MIIQADAQSILIAGLQNNDYGLYVEPDVNSFKKAENNIVLVANQQLTEKAKKQLSSSALIVSKPGEYEMHTIFTYALPAGDSVAYLITAEHIHIGVLWVDDFGSVSQDVKDELDIIEVLIVSFANPDMWISDKKLAEKLLPVISTIDPRILVIAYPDKHPAGKTLISELGGDASKLEKKIKLARKDLPADQMRIVGLAS